MQRQVLMAAIVLVGTAGGLCAAAEGPASGDADAKRVVARVNQVEITYEEFQKRLESLQQQRGPVRPEQFKDVVRGMVQEEILIQDAATEGLDQEAAVKAKLEQARRRVMIEELLQRKVIAQSQVTDDEARKMYEDNKPLFSTETMRVGHIMVKTEAEAEAILKELQAGKDFAELAKASRRIRAARRRGATWPSCDAARPCRNSRRQPSVSRRESSPPWSRRSTAITSSRAAPTPPPSSPLTR
jgi:peptidyl-prolyl cis-trans isomerase C